MSMKSMDVIINFIMKEEHGELGSKVRREKVIPFTSNATLFGGTFLLFCVSTVVKNIQKYSVHSLNSHH